MTTGPKRLKGWGLVAGLAVVTVFVVFIATRSRNSSGGPPYDGLHLSAVPKGQLYMGKPAVLQVAMADGALDTLISYPSTNGGICLGLGRASHLYEYVQQCLSPSATPVVIGLGDNNASSGRLVLAVLPNSATSVKVKGFGQAPYNSTIDLGR